MKEKGKAKPGRPCGRIKTDKIEIAIEPEIKEEFKEIMFREGKKVSVEIGMWIRDYIKVAKKKEKQQ